MRRVIIVLALLVVAAACTDRESGSPGGRRPTTPSAGDLTFAPRSLLYMKGRVLRVRDGATDQDRVVKKLPSADVSVSPDGDFVAYVASAGPTTGEEDFVADPELAVLQVASGDVRELGPGLLPSFSPTGDLLARLVPVGKRRCEGEVCEGESRLVAGPVDGGATELLPAGRWVILGWAGDRVLVVDQDDPSVVKLVGRDAPPARLAVPASSLWGGSPDGDQILLSGQDVAEFRVLEATGLGSGSTLVALNGALGEGSWSLDGATVAAVLIGDLEAGVPQTELVTVASHEGRVDTIAGSEGAAGQVLWSPDGGSLAYARSAPPRGLRLAAVRCSRPPDGPCKSLFSWRRDVQLLHLY